MVPSAGEAVSGYCKHDGRLVTRCVVTAYVEYTANNPEHRVAEIEVACLECGAVAQWRAPGGLSPREPMTSFDATELRAPFVFVKGRPV